MCKAPFNYKNSRRLSPVIDSSILSPSNLYFFLDFPPPLFFFSSFLPSLPLDKWQIFFFFFFMPSLYGCTWNKNSFLLVVGWHLQMWENLNTTNNMEFEINCNGSGSLFSPPPMVETMISSPSAPSQAVSGQKTSWRRSPWRGSRSSASGRS